LRNAYKILCPKPERKKPLLKSRIGWEYNIAEILKREIEFIGLRIETTGWLLQTLL
jgi:hypothetical protein